MKKMRLDKFLAKTGPGSRRDAKKLARSGRVKVDGEIITDPSQWIDPNASVQVGDNTLEYKEHHYLMLNKPAGVVSATRDRLNATVLGLLPEQYQHLDLFPVGRLDKDTLGLLVLTDDGALAHRLLSPKKKVPKVYRALVRGEVGAEHAEQFSQGIELQDITCLPAQLEILDPGKQSRVQVTIYEGKYHQVKRMFAAVDKEVLELQRVAMGGLWLDDQLQPGEVRELTPVELELLEKGGDADEPLL